MKWEYVVIIILVIILGLLVAKLNDKRKTDIIKLLIKKDLLPEAGEGTKWLEGGSCYMGDGTLGTVHGRYCEQLKPL